MKHRRSKGLTISELAHRAGVSTRTVRRDISAGRLPVVRVNSRVVHIRAIDAKRYRRRLAKTFITPADLAKRCRVSRRTIWNWIARGEISIVARRSSRHVLVSIAELRRRFWWRLPAEEDSRAQPERKTIMPGACFTVRKVADLGKKSAREIYHAITKGALPAVTFADRRPQLWIPQKAAEDYLRK